jgi:transposase
LAPGCGFLLPLYATAVDVHMHDVTSDATGAVDVPILDPILGRERNPETVAELRARRTRAFVGTVARSLVGEHRPEHLF